MSTTFAPSSRTTQKRTCPKCKRTVYVVAIDGAHVETDPELISVVPFEQKPAEKIMARRAHAELCSKYQIDAERVAARKADKRIKKLLASKREPGM